MRLKTLSVDYTDCIGVTVIVYDVIFINILFRINLFAFICTNIYLRSINNFSLVK